MTYLFIHLFMYFEMLEIKHNVLHRVDKIFTSVLYPGPWKDYKII